MRSLPVIVYYAELSGKTKDDAKIGKIFNISRNPSGLREIF
jgi:hypothetical protein